jgi:hypothetical protein
MDAPITLRQRRIIEPTVTYSPLVVKVGASSRADCRVCAQVKPDWSEFRRRRRSDGRVSPWTSHDCPLIAGPSDSPSCLSSSSPSLFVIQALPTHSFRPPLPLDMLNKARAQWLSQGPALVKRCNKFPRLRLGLTTVPLSRSIPFLFISRQQARQLDS